MRKEIRGSKMLQRIGLALIFLWSLESCSPTGPVFCKTICGGFIAANEPLYTCEEYRLIESLWIQEIQTKIPDACQNLAGYVSWEMPGFSSLIYVDPKTKKELQRRFNPQAQGMADGLVARTDSRSPKMLLARPN
jgi:hypothetical protein